MNPALKCINNDVGAQVLPGQRIGESDIVSGYRTVQVQSGASIMWLAPDLGCAQLKVVTTLDGGINEQVATLINPGEPDGVLFDIPEWYPEVPPSTFYELDATNKTVQKLDRQYFSRRPRQ
jgi:hypothetical protein